MVSLDEERVGRRGRSEANGRGNGQSGEGSTSGDGVRHEDHGWLPVDSGQQPTSRVAASKAPETPVPFRRVENGSRTYRGPSDSDPMYSPLHYHFSRMQAHQTNGPLNIWLGLLAIVGIGLALLLVVALPGLLTHTRSVAVASPSFTSTTSQFVVPLVGPTSTPTRTDGPSASPSVAPGPSYRTYKVQSGDTITRIANKFGLKTWELLLANPGLTAKSTLQINRVLNIPKPGQLTPAP